MGFFRYILFTSYLHLSVSHNEPNICEDKHLLITIITPEYIWTGQSIHSLIAGNYTSFFTTYVGALQM
jgi:hypothetical protein